MNAVKQYTFKRTGRYSTSMATEVALSLDKFQAFLDLLGAADLPLEKLQVLYQYHAELVSHIEARFNIVTLAN